MVAMFDLANYSGILQDILSGVENGARLMPLAPASELAHEGLSLLRRTATADLFDEPPADLEFADCVRGAAFLYFSALDDSHRVSQQIGSATGSLLHGVMHRQEPDYSNAKYWFRRTGKHELYPTLRAEALRLPLEDDRLRKAIASQPDWDALWFVDVCERAVGGDSALESDAVEIQRLEWRLIFDYCYRRAVVG